MRLAAIFETPRAVPRRTLPIAAAAALLALALPVCIVAGLPLGGWLLAAVLWLSSQAFQAVLARLGIGADKLASSGVVGIGMMFRAIAVGVVLIAVAAADARLGVTAAVLYALAYTLELALSLVAYFAQEPA